MAVVCFRLVPLGLGSMPALAEELSSLDRRLVEAVNRVGKVYPTYTTLNDQAAMRLAVGNILTTERHLAKAFDLIRREAVHGRAAPSTPFRRIEKNDKHLACRSHNQRHRHWMNSKQPSRSKAACILSTLAEAAEFEHNLMCMDLYSGSASRRRPTEPDA
jgi:hypothetical protein